MKKSDIFSKNENFIFFGQILIFRFFRQNFGFSIFFSKKYFFIFKMTFFCRKKKLRKKSNYYIDVEFCQESISGNQKLIGALFQKWEPITPRKPLNFLLFFRLSPLGQSLALIFRPRPPALKLTQLRAQIDLEFFSHQK